MPLPPDDQLYRDIVEGVGDAFVFADSEGVIRLWSAGAEATFGYRRDQAIGQSLDLIVPERLRQRHWDGFRETMRTGQTRYARELLAVPAMRADGQRISVEFTVSMVRDERAEVVGVAAVMRDVTRRWQEERGLR